MRSDPEDVGTAVTISRATTQKMHQYLAWAAGYNSRSRPGSSAAWLVLRPEVGANSMAGSSIIVALNPVALKRLRLPARTAGQSVGDARPKLELAKA